MTNIEHFEMLDKASRTRVLTDVESYALERLVKTRDVLQHMDDKRKALR